MLRVRSPAPPDSCSPVCLSGVWCCVRGVLGHLTPDQRCVRWLRCVLCAVSWSQVCLLGVLCCVCGLLGHLASVYQCACSVCGAVCAVSCATWLLFTNVLAPCVVLPARCPGPLDSCSPVCALAVLCCVRGVLGHLAPVQQCASSSRCVAWAVSYATWLLSTSVLARCVVLLVPCPGPLGPCSPVCALGALCCVCGVLGHLTPVHQLARSVRCVACAVSWATGLLFTGVLARCAVLHARCPWPLGSCKPVCALALLCCMCPVLADLATVRRCVGCELFVACAVSWATWRLFTGVLARCVMLRVRCPAPPDSCSPVCLLGVWCCVRGVLGHLTPDQRCARWLRCVLCAVSCATWLLVTGVLAWCAVLRLRCPRPLGSGLPVCLLRVWCRVCGVLRHLAPVHRCACSVCGVACAVSWAT